jgi:hypothetical protein
MTKRKGKQGHSKWVPRLYGLMPHPLLHSKWVPRVWGLMPHPLLHSKWVPRLCGLMPHPLLHSKWVPRVWGLMPHPLQIKDNLHQSQFVSIGRCWPTPRLRFQAIFFPTFSCSNINFYSLVNSFPPFYPQYLLTVSLFSSRIEPKPGSPDVKQQSSINQ